MDISAMPSLLEASYDKYDTEGCLRPTTIDVRGSWTYVHQDSLMTKPYTTILGKDDQVCERQTLTHASFSATPCSKHLAIQTAHDNMT